MTAQTARVTRFEEPDDFRKVFALAAESSIMLITAVVISRRLSGAFVGPVSDVVPCAVATFAALLSLAALALRRIASASNGSARNSVEVIQGFARTNLRAQGGATEASPGRESRESRQPNSSECQFKDPATTGSRPWLEDFRPLAGAEEVDVGDRPLFELPSSLQAYVIAAALTVIPPIALGAALSIGISPFSQGYLAALGIACAVGALAIEDHTSGSLLTSQLRAALFRRDVRMPLTRQIAAPGRHDSMETSTATAVAPVMPAGPASAEMPEAPAENTRSDESLEQTPGEEAESDPSLVQWMTRRRLPDGGERIEGAVRIELGSTEKVGVAHLAFSPPLPRDPEAECHLISDFDGRVRITTAKSYGLRIEARLSGEPSGPVAIDVAFSAVAQSAAKRAAAA
jgi:hypothetical protein